MGRFPRKQSNTPMISAAELWPRIVLWCWTPLLSCQDPRPAQIFIRAKTEPRGFSAERSAQRLGEGAESRRRPRRPDLSRCRLIFQHNNSEKGKKLILLGRRKKYQTDLNMWDELLTSHFLRKNKPYPKKRVVFSSVSVSTVTLRCKMKPVFVFFLSCCVLTGWSNKPWRCKCVSEQHLVKLAEKFHNLSIPQREIVLKCLNFWFNRTGSFQRHDSSNRVKMTSSFHETDCKLYCGATMNAVLSEEKQKCWRASWDRS